MPLTNLKVDKAKPKEKQYKLADERGMYLLVYPKGGKWWRREGDLLVENWVLVDIPHVLLQMGYDLFANMTEEAV